MTEVTHFRWVPYSALPPLARRFDAVLQPWAQSWGCQPACGQAQIATSDLLTEPSGASESNTWVSMAGAGGPWMRLSTSWASEFAAELFGPGAATSRLAPEVAGRAVQALQSHLHEAWGTEVNAPIKAAAAAKRPKLGHWGVHYCSGVGPKGVHLLASVDWLHHQGWLDRPAPPALKAHPWISTLARLPLSVRVDLGQACVPVGDLFNLNVGDVILVNQTIAQALPVRVLGTDVQLRAHLGQMADQRAVQFISTTPAGTP